MVLTGLIAHAVRREPTKDNQKRLGRAVAEPSNNLGQKRLRPKGTIEPERLPPRPLIGT
jgi:hypothetical protein